MFRRFPTPAALSAALAASALLFALGALPSLHGVPALPRAVDAQAAATTYVCGYDDTHPTPNAQDDTQHCSGGVHCVGSADQCWISASITVHTGDYVDWENGTGYHSLVPIGWNGGGALGYSTTFSSPGVYKYRCYYHSTPDGSGGYTGMVGSVTVLQAPASPSPTGQPTPTSQPTPTATPTEEPTATPQPTDSANPTPNPTHSSSGGGTSHRSPTPTRSASGGSGATPSSDSSPPVVALNPSAYPSIVISPGHPLTGDTSKPAANASATEPFGVRNFWLYAVAAVVALGVLLVGAGVVLLVRGRGGNQAPPAAA